MRLIWLKVSGSDVGFVANHIVRIAAESGKTRVHLSTGEVLLVDEMVLTVTRQLQELVLCPTR